MTTAHRLNARLDRDLARKLDEIKLRSGMSTTEVLRAALERYYESENAPLTPADVLEEAGFVGCIAGPRDLSTTYKTKLARSLRSKTRR